MLPPHVDADNWQEGPANRWAYQHIDEVVATSVVPRGDGPVLELVEPSGPGLQGISQFLDDTCTDGFLVLCGRQIVDERYFAGMTPSTRHLLQSVSKSMLGCVVGRLVERGELDLTRTLGSYVPPLDGSAYGDATLQQALDMAVAVAYDETYDDPASEVQMHDRVGGWRTRLDTDPPGIEDFLAGLAATGPHGERFQYCSANTDALSWVLETVTGSRFADLLSRELWSRIGAEHDALVTVDRLWFAMPSGGVCVTLRDLARFGRVVLDGGVGPTGEQVVPARWIDDVRASVDRPRLADRAPAMGDGTYRNQFWVTADPHGCFYGVGIYGQYVWMSPQHDVVIAKLSTLPHADAPGDWERHLEFFDRVVTEVGGAGSAT
jgi:CubicO group peptidase (beta-lactamase class C family)